MLRLPAVVVNFKLYRQASGKNAVELAKKIDYVAKETGASVAIAVNPLDFHFVKDSVEIPVYLQHVDAVDFGARTGRINVEIAKEHGVDGILVNHSERRLKIADIEYLVSRARKVGVDTMVCTNNPSVSAAVAALGPDYIAMEPPELIGGDISVSKARPEAITETINAVKSIKEIPVLVGAGVKNGEDVRRAVELGAKGVLVASGITKARDPKAALMDLISGLM